MSAKKPNKTPKPLTGRKVILGFVAFFAVVITVNGIMTYFAIDTFSGIETEDAYRKGRDFNQEIQLAMAEKELGWHVTVVEEKILPKSEFTTGPMPLHMVTIHVKDKSGDLMRGLLIEGSIIRPVVKGFDQAVWFRPMPNGSYVAAADLPDEGNWQLKAVIKDGDGNSRQIVEDLFFAPQNDK